MERNETTREIHAQQKIETKRGHPNGKSNLVRQKCHRRAVRISWLHYRFHNVRRPFYAGDGGTAGTRGRFPVSCCSEHCSETGSDPEYRSYTLIHDLVSEHLQQWENVFWNHMQTGKHQHALAPRREG